MRFMFTFICQRGELEAKAVLLAASLRRHLASQAEMVACLPVPEDAWGCPSRHALRALESLGVSTAPVRNPFAKAYPIGNKIACLNVPAATHGAGLDRVVFLDSDILCMAPFSPDRELAADFSAKPVDFATFAGGPAEWTRLYNLFGLPEPGRRVVATVSREETWPYFNAGVIGVRADAGLAHRWEECCRRIDAEDWVPSRRPHLDQIALPIATALCGLDFVCLDERMNYPAHLRPLRATPPALCHYHRPDIAAKEPSLTNAVRSLVDEFPALRPVLDADFGWRSILGAPRRRRWFSGSLPEVPAPLLAAAPANDVTADNLAAALERSPTPDLLQTVVDVSRHRFGWFTRHPSRTFEYPWVVAKLSGRRGGRVVDVGAGVSPVPLLLALYGVRMTTVDNSDLVRDSASGMAGWDEWGFLDYAKLDASITSIRVDAAELQLPENSYEAVYSISVVEHMPAATRRRLWSRLDGWLAPGGALLLTVDLVPGTEHLWNRASGWEVEPIYRHGDLSALTAELGGFGFRLDERIDLRGLQDMRADVALLAYAKVERPGSTA